MKPIEIFTHLCSSLIFLYAVFMSAENLETVFQEISWMLLRIFYILVSISLEISLINLKEVK